MTETLFDPNKLVETVETIDDSKDYLTEYVGTGKKFADASALAKAKAQSDLFIKRMETENKAMRDELTRLSGELKTRTSLDEFLEKVRSAQKEPTVTTSNQDNQANEPVLNEEKIAELIETRLTAKERALQASTNLRAVQEGLIKAYGQDYVPVLSKRAQDLGVDKAFLDNLAQTAPKAFFAALGITLENKQSSIFAPPNTVTSSPSSTNSGAKNEKYYQALRKKLSPAEYYAPAIQNEKFEMAKKLGDSFYE